MSCKTNYDQQNPSKEGFGNELQEGSNLVFADDLLLFTGMLNPKSDYRKKKKKEGDGSWVLIEGRHYSKKEMGPIPNLILQTQIHKKEMSPIPNL